MAERQSWVKYGMESGHLIYLVTYWKKFCMMYFITWEFNIWYSCELWPGGYPRKGKCIQVLLPHITSSPVFNILDYNMDHMSRSPSVGINLVTHKFGFFKFQLPAVIKKQSIEIEKLCKRMLIFIYFYIHSCIVFRALLPDSTNRQ